jgi:hypothetical protein
MTRNGRPISTIDGDWSRYIGLFRAGSKPVTIPVSRVRTSNDYKNIKSATLAPILGGI